MGTRRLNLNDELYDYLLSVSIRETDVQRALREDDAALSSHIMQIPPEQALFLQLLIKLMGAKQVVELGTYTGYSALSMALALPDDGRLITCDISDEWTSIAQKYWQQDGVEYKITLKLGPALETLADLEATHTEQIDFIFIDADKVNYPYYYEAALKLLRQGGLIVIDNVLWGGKVADKQYQDGAAPTLRKLNETLFHDQRIDISLLPVADGLSLLCKR